MVKFQTLVSNHKIFQMFAVSEKEEKSSVHGIGQSRRSRSFPLWLYIITALKIQPKQIHKYDYHICTYIYVNTYKYMYKDSGEEDKLLTHGIGLSRRNRSFPRYTIMPSWTTHIYICIFTMTMYIIMCSTLQHIVYYQCSTKLTQFSCIYCEPW